MERNSKSKQNKQTNKQINVMKGTPKIGCKQI